MGFQGHNKIEFVVVARNSMLNRVDVLSAELMTTWLIYIFCNW